RIWVLQTLRNELENLARAENLNVTFTLSNSGELTLEGTVLNETRVTKFVELVKDRTLGIARLESRIKTAKTLLADVEKLAQVSQIQPWVLFREDGERIEASGALPIEKIDAWAGFLQSYARRFARDIGLRSFVQLQNISVTVADGNQRQAATPVSQAITI